MIITSMLRIVMNKINKVSISSIVEEGNVEYENFEIDEIGLNETHMSLINNFDETIEPAEAIYKNENILKNKVIEQVNGTIVMYQELLGDVACCLKKYDVRRDGD